MPEGVRGRVRRSSGSRRHQCLSSALYKPEGHEGRCRPMASCWPAAGQLRQARCAARFLPQKRRSSKWKHSVGRSVGLGGADWEAGPLPDQRESLPNGDAMTYHPGAGTSQRRLDPAASTFPGGSARHRPSCHMEMAACLPCCAPPGLPRSLLPPAGPAPRALSVCLSVRASVQG